MTDPEPASETDARDRAVWSDLRRRTFIGVGGGVGATLLAGCTGELATNDPAGDDTRDGEAESGSFRFLVSDMPADIGDFDSLDVSLEKARIFRGDEDDETAGEETEDDDADADDEVGDEADGDDEAAATDDDGADGPDGGDGDEGADGEDEDEGADEGEDERADDENEDDSDENEDDSDENEDDSDADDRDDDEGDGNRNWYELDLDAATVDLTQVVGDRAMGVFEGELSAGRYAKVELYVADVEGIVDGELVDVKVPSGKLQIVKPFEIRADETVSFVFDINVVKKGPDGGYNLLPVIGESGVVGRDVEVEEIDRDDGDDESDDEDEADEDDENATSDGDAESDGDGESDDGDVVTGDDDGSDGDGA